ncbi:DUF4349 domain-containing protein [Bacillus taeanensis]|uniref:DUF4349 domain-containing protein n=1 Tax=Bacillus taeanensis TaxID=273032 RepID=A0A366XWK1_9BACI|nr:DUF4349 domain-containing protein [Bacillus taeanensis]RBW69928.1 hypothetical protein DS031_08710 [Bacillus taeanensis]
MRKKTLFIKTILFAVSLLLLFGCSNNTQNESAEMDMAVSEESGNLENKKAEIYKESEGETEQLTNKSERKIIYEAYLTVEFENFQENQKELEKLIKAKNGYVVESTLYDEEKSRKEGTIIAKIPHEKFETALNEIAQIGDVTHRSMNGRDVTEEYVDLTSRLKSKQAVEKRLYAFLEKASDTQSLLNISKELSFVQEEIEQLKGKINYIENQTDYSMVTITMIENSPAEISNNNGLHVWKGSKQLFIDTINILIRFFSGAIIITIGLSPVLLPLIGVVIFIYWRYKKKNTD